MIDSLLSVLSLLLEFLQLFVRLTVLLLELLKFAKSLQFLFIDDFSLVAAFHCSEAVRLRREAGVH